MSVIATLITDRTEQDVLDVIEALKSGINYVPKKGAYNADDFNRVGSAVNYLVGEYDELGYLINDFVPLKITWIVTDVPTEADYDNYLNWVRALRDYIPNTIDADIYTLPLTMDRIDFEDANDIERVLQEVDIIIENIKSSWFYANDLQGGEVLG